MSKICSKTVFAVAAFAVLLAPAFLPLALAGPGHDHGPSPSVAAGPSSPRIVAVSETYEFVAIFKDGQLTIYLDRLADTSPVGDAKIELIVDGESGVAEPQPDDTYLFKSPHLAKEGEREVIVTIQHGEKSDLLVGKLTIPHAQHTHGHDHDHPHDDTVADGNQNAKQPLLTQKLTEKLSKPPVLIGLALAFGVLVGALVHGRTGLMIGLVGLIAVFGAGSVLAGPGHDHGHGHDGGGASGNGDAPRRLPDGSVFLPKPTQRLLDIRTRILAPKTTQRAEQLIGRVITDPNRSGLIQSTIGGRIKPAPAGLPVLGQKVSAGDIIAYVEPAFAPIDASDVSQTAGELAQRITLLEARIRRQKRLVRKKVAGRANLEDLRIELEGLQARREQLTKSSVEPEALRAPVDGVIAEVKVAAGQVVGAADTLFHIVDPASLWVEAISYDPGLRVDGAGIKARTANGDVFKLTFVGRSRTLQQQAAVLQFKIANPTDALHIGSPVKVLIETGAPLTGLIIPRSAIAQAPNGQMVTFLRLEPEKYQPQPVRFDTLDADRVHITGGLKQGDQIIIRSAPLVNQIR
ncbi:MAG: efflux RND transporter periplasmic adaptor subunit [Alphaproteobacteria bacterium]|nr:efflux RND transporter periplasmic adaptor subunit [Alphaproteobacteria bacterium]